MAKKNPQELSAATGGHDGRFSNFIRVTAGIVSILLGLLALWTVIRHCRDAPQLNVREVVPLVRPDQPVEIKLAFSVLGKRFAPIYVNKVFLREDVQAPPPVGPFRTVIDVRAIEDHIKLRPGPEPGKIVAIRIADNLPPLAPVQPPGVHEIFAGTRKRLDPEDQLDFLLIITVEVEPSIDGAPPGALGKWIGLEAHWEDADGVAGVLASLVKLPLADIHFEVIPQERKKH